MNVRAVPVSIISQSQVIHDASLYFGARGYNYQIKIISIQIEH